MREALFTIIIIALPVLAGAVAGWLTRASPRYLLLGLVATALLVGSLMGSRENHALTIWWWWWSLALSLPLGAGLLIGRQCQRWWPPPLPLETLFRKKQATNTWTTKAIGIISFEVDGEVSEAQHLLRVIHSSATGRFQLENGREDFSTLEEAQRSAQTKGATENFSADLKWRDSVAAEQDEQECFLCKCTLGRPMESRERHPERICSVCFLEATDMDGRPVRYFTELTKPQLSGEIRGAYRDTGAAYEAKYCLIRGIRCEVGEAHFGGVVVERAKAL